MGGETQYSTLQSMEIIFTEFIFAYSLAKCHKKVVTIIFYFARAVSHAAVRTDRLCYIYSALPPPLSHIAVQYFLSCGETNYTPSGHLKSRRKIDDFGPDQNARFSERFQGEKLTFWPAFFLKHKLLLILPIIMQKNSEVG